MTRVDLHAHTIPDGDQSQAGELARGANESIARTPV